MIQLDGNTGPFKGTPIWPYIIGLRRHDDTEVVTIMSRIDFEEMVK